MRHIYAALLVVLSLTISVGAFSQPSPKALQIETKKESKRSVQYQQESKQTKSQPPVALATVSTESDAKKKSEQSSEEGTEFWPSFFGFRFKVTDSLLVLFTAVLAVFTGLLWHSTKKLWKETEAAGGTAKIAADAAKRAAEVAESALLKVERPYLLVTASGFNIGVNTVDGNGSFYHPVVTYSISNHGKLPAIIDLVCAEVIHAPDERLTTPISVDDTDPLLMDRVIESNGWRQNLEFRNSPIDAAIANSPALTSYEIFFWIVIYYHGPFTEEHETSGCWRVSFEQKDKLKLIQYGHDRYNYTR